MGWPLFLLVKLGAEAWRFDLNEVGGVIYV